MVALPFWKNCCLSCALRPVVLKAINVNYFKSSAIPDAQSRWLEFGLLHTLNVSMIDLLQYLKVAKMMPRSVISLLPQFSAVSLPLLVNAQIQLSTNILAFHYIILNKAFDTRT